MDIEIVNGDLRPYFDKPITEMKDFLSHHWEDVSKASQQPFNYEILDRADLLYDTEPACRAVVVVRHMNREKELSFFKMIQKAFYFHNKDLRIIENYDSILEALDLDKEVFREGFNYEKYKALVKEDFNRAASLGVQGFPTIFLQSKDKLLVLSRGYTTFEKLNSSINKVN